MILRCALVILASLSSYLNVEATPCVDSPLDVIYAGGVVGCDDDDLSKCDERGAKSHCPVTCSACDEYACADSERNFVRDGVGRNCRGLLKLSDEDFELACSYPDVASTCRSTCNFCATSEPTLPPTPEPTLPPTPDPVDYGDVIRLVNCFDPARGYLMSYGYLPDLTGGYGVYTSVDDFLNPIVANDPSVAEWEIMKVLSDGSAVTGGSVRYGDTVRLANQYPLNGIFTTLMSSGNHVPTNGFGVYTAPPSSYNVHDWVIMKALPDGGDATGELVQLGDSMRFVNVYDPNKGYLITSGLASPSALNGFNVYTSPNWLDGSGACVGEWTIEAVPV